ncbi:MAG: site-2 protease family protein [Thermodesulfovibrionales bacterium]|nr:site-2 protease family protein [Thermodesulfovibrionales bacterium]
MESFLKSGSFKVATIIGIPIKIHFSWLVIFALISWSLSNFYFPQADPRVSVLYYWIFGIIGSLMLFLSVVLHELAHSYIALKYKLSIINITLFIFGGVAQMKGEPSTPRAEIKIALAGPFISFLLAITFFVIYLLFEEPLKKALFRYLAQLNLILGAFNLIPGFPMDGGRVVRAYLWDKTKNFFHATRKASNYGQKIALLFIVIGLLSLFSGFTTGLWLVLIGWFIYSAAQSSYQQASLEETLDGVKVRDIMVKEIISLPPDMTVETAVYDYFLRYGFGGFPVMDGEKLYGFVTLKEVKDVQRDKWEEVKLLEIYKPISKNLEISEKDSAMTALELMINEDAGRLIVKDGERIIGLITRNGIAQYVQLMSR